MRFDDLMRAVIISNKMLSNTLLLNNFYILIAVLRKRWNLKEIEISNIAKAIDGEDLSFLV